MSYRKPKIALWFRYGPAEHSELFHAMPQIVERLAEYAEVHYFGLKTRKPIPPRIVQHAKIHTLPFWVDRKDDSDKLVKTLIWVACMPLMGLYCRCLGIGVVYIDETLPLSAFLTRVFFGKRVALTVADFFTEVFMSKTPAMEALGKRIRSFDERSWRNLPLIFTRARTAKTYLESRGVPGEVIHPVHDPCDLTVYRRIDRQEARKIMDLPQDAFILVHHGILHPNKGNDRIIRALAELKPNHPDIKYLLVGSGSDMDALRELVRELDLEDTVIFTGWLDTLEEVNGALNAADVGLVMRVGQESDNFHTTGALVHNMAVGLPVLAAKLGGVADIIHHEENGLLFDPDDMEEFKQQLLRMRDDGMRQRFGDAVLKQAAELYDMDKVTEQTVTPLLKLLRTGSV